MHRSQQHRILISLLFLVRRSILKWQLIFPSTPAQQEQNRAPSKALKIQHWGALLHAVITTCSWGSISRALSHSLQGSVLMARESSLLKHSTHKLLQGKEDGRVLPSWAASPPMLFQEQRMGNMGGNRTQEKTHLKVSGSQTPWLISQIFRGHCSEAKRKETYSYFAERNYSCYITCRREG